MTSTPPAEQFASDNNAGICPAAWAELERANSGHATAYGDDDWTRQAVEATRKLFEADCDVFFVFNGTAGNALALAALCRSYEAVICHRLAHVEVDECGAPQFFSGGAKLLTCVGENGKLTPAIIDEVASRRTDLHFPPARAVSITQATEVGTLYQVDELHELCRAAHRRGLTVHMDGARFANAVAELGCSPRQLTVDCGIDVLCFGGTKNGMAVGDAVIFFNRELARDFSWRCKQAGQLASKMRFITAPWNGLLREGAWLDNARHANQCAALLESRLRQIEGVTILFPRQANTLFVHMADWALAALTERGWHFYIFPDAGGARFMCSWDTRVETVERFAADIRTVLSNRGANDE